MKKIDQFDIRDKSCLTNKTVTERAISIKNFPVFFGCVTHPYEDDLYTDMDFFIEKETGLIQLNKLIPIDVLYQEQHAFGFGLSWANHYDAFSQFISKNNVTNVVEIGGATDKLALRLIDNTKNYTIIEPNPSKNIDNRIKIIKSFFENLDVDLSNYDSVIFSHVLEHAYDPSRFLGDLYRKINENAKVYFSYPQLETWLEKKHTNSLNFEHNLFLTEKHLDVLLNNIGFVITEKYKYKDHSVFYNLEKSVTIKKLKYPNLYTSHLKLINEYKSYHIQEVQRLNKIISSNKYEQIYLFGAHIFSQILIVFGLDISKIEFILDNSVQKQNKRLYGTTLTVRSPSILVNKKNVLVILKAANYNSEIKEDILNNINDNIEFLE